MKKISSETVCTFFYAFFVIYAIIFAIVVLTFFGFLGYAKKLGMAGVGLSLQALIGMGIAGTQMLFFYLICDRALLTAKPEASPKQIAY